MLYHRCLNHSVPLNFTGSLKITRCGTSAWMTRTWEPCRILTWDGGISCGQRPLCTRTTRTRRTFHGTTRWPNLEQGQLQEPSEGPGQWRVQINFLDLFLLWTKLKYKEICFSNCYFSLIFVCGQCRPSNYFSCCTFCYFRTIGSFLEMKLTLLSPIHNWFI